MVSYVELCLDYVRLGLVRYGLVQLYKLYLFYYLKVKHFTLDFLGAMITGTAADMHNFWVIKYKKLGKSAE